MIKIINIDQSAPNIWRFGPKRGKYPRNSLFCNMKKERFFINYAEDLAPCYTKEGLFDTSLSRIIVKPNGYPLIVGPDGNDDNHFILFISFNIKRNDSLFGVHGLTKGQKQHTRDCTKPGNTLSFVKEKSEILDQKIYRENGVVYYNLVVKLLNPLGYISTNRKHKFEHLFTWEGFETYVDFKKARNRLYEGDACKMNVSHRTVYGEIPKANLTEKGGFLQERAELNHIISSSRYRKKHFVLELSRVKYLLDKRKLNYSYAEYEDCFHFNGKTYYYSDDSLYEIMGLYDMEFNELIRIA
ncbi:MAG TPA: hypothetical protein DCL21_01320 [Alphaproteobacteria bacterium]|nr:hypothetical protein [Alphaproteobacteria bacterium]